MCPHTPPWLRVLHTPISQCCDIFKLGCLHPYCSKYMQNALSFKKPFSYLILSCLGIRLQHQMWRNVSFCAVFMAKGSCILKKKYCLSNYIYVIAVRGTFFIILPSGYFLG